jgi:hypothetical protein
MEENSVKDMIESGRLSLSFWRKLDHYFFVVFVLFIPALTTYYLIQYYFFDSYYGIRTSRELAEDYLWLIPALIIVIVQWNRLKFKKYKITASEDEIYKALNLTSQELNWRIEKRSPNFIRAFRDWDLTASWGEMITIIPTGGSILINSICDPHKRTSIASFGMNKTNTRTFIINLYNVVNATSIRKPEELENKWSVSNTIFRILAYPFCIGLILLAVFSMIPNGEILLGIFCIIIPAYYFYTDLT